jgi:hypothetical protein
VPGRWVVFGWHNCSLAQYIGIDTTSPGICGSLGGFYSIFRDGTIVSRVATGVTAAALYSNSYVSGIEFQENQIVSIQAPPVNSTSFSDWELRGFQTDIN